MYVVLYSMYRYVCCIPDCRVVFKFKSSKRSNNGTDVGSGQIPQILYRIPEPEKDEGVQIQLLGKAFSSSVSAVCCLSMCVRDFCTKNRMGEEIC